MNDQDNGQTTRRTLLAGGLALSAAACQTPLQRVSGSASKRRPNIIFIMADDLGYADLSCYGRRDYTTPRIDELARTGLKFVQAYSSSPVCSATRTALMTGRYQYRLPIGLEEPLTSRPVGLPPAHPTLPGLLRAAGYQTALIGKWHLGELPDFGPLKSGYEHFWGFRSGSVDYFTHDSLSGRPDLWDGDIPVESTGYATTLLGDKSVEMIDLFSRSGRPFFLSLHFTAPHWPWQGDNDDAEAARLAGRGPGAIFHLDGGTMATYAAMVRAMDTQVGRVTDQLKRLGIADDTIIIFTSDNGGERFSDTWPFTGIKTELLEGGIRVPLIIRWPGHTRPGTETGQVAVTMDFLPTLLSATGAAAAPDHPSDGMDLTDQLAGAPIIPRKLFFRYAHLEQQAHRDGNWKYLRINGNEFLFDIIADPMERANLKDRYPDIFAGLVGAYRDWEAGMLPLDPAAFTHGYSGAQLADHINAGR